MRELSPVLRAVVNSGLLKDHLLTCYRKGRPSMTERERILHDRSAYSIIHVYTRMCTFLTKYVDL